MITPPSAITHKHIHRKCCRNKRANQMFVQNQQVFWKNVWLMIFVSWLMMDSDFRLHLCYVFFFFRSTLNEFLLAFRLVNVAALSIEINNNLTNWNDSIKRILHHTNNLYCCYYTVRLIFSSLFLVFLCSLAVWVFVSISISTILPPQKRFIEWMFETRMAEEQNSVSINVWSVITHSNRTIIFEYCEL